MSATSGNFSEETEKGFEPCSMDDINNLGAILSIFYFFMFFFNVVTNVLVLVIIFWFKKQRSVVYIFLINLVVSSLIFISSLPFLAIYMQLSKWIFGAVMCKIVFSVYYLGFYSSVLFLTLLTLDRYIGVVHLMPRIHVRTRRNAIIACTVVWVLSGLACLRSMLLHRIIRHLDIYYCERDVGDNNSVEMVQNLGFYFQLFIFLILPLGVITYCYVKIAITIISSSLADKFKAVRVIFFLVVLFFLCWIPFNIIELLHDKHNTCEERKRLGYALTVSRNMAYFYFCINPIFFTFVGNKFWNHFKQLLVTCFPRLEKPISIHAKNRATMRTGATELRSYPHVAEESKYTEMIDCKSEFTQSKRSNGRYSKTCTIPESCADTLLQQ